jgi:Fic family protein
MTWDSTGLMPALLEVRLKQGRLLGFLEALGFTMRDETALGSTTLDVLKSSEIEGENLDPAQVRSSVARKLGMHVAGLVPSDREVDGVVEMMVDATRRFDEALTKKRLLGWRAALFPEGTRGAEGIAVGRWRAKGKGPMQVVSGALGKERVHFEAPATDRIPAAMRAFLKWVNEEDGTDQVIRSAVAHLWFLTIHPFDDGNGRVARAISDMLLARSDGSRQRFFSMSAQIRAERKDYYQMLETSQKGGLDVTSWIAWYLGCLNRALDAASDAMSSVLERTRFWDKHASTDLNERQRKMINRLFGGFTGHLTTSKWAKMTRCSQDTALRDIQELVEKRILKKSKAGGRSTIYHLSKPRHV